MASAVATSSPRDHAADDNPGLARKRQRLSEDPGLSPSSSVHVELCEPEVIQDELADIIMEPDQAMQYIDAFFHEDYPDPKQQLDTYREELERNYHVDHHVFLWMASGLQAHLEQTEDDSQSWRSHYLGDEAAFFVSLARTSTAFLGQHDHFEPSVDIGRLDYQDAFHMMIIHLRAICQRILPLLPDCISHILSRRDSALGTNQPQTLEPLWYVVLAEKVLYLESIVPAITQFSDHDFSKRYSRVYTFDIVGPILLDVRSALANTIHDMSSSMRELKDSWAILDSALVLFRFSLSARPIDGETFPAQDVEHVLEALDGPIKSAICAKHSRALPESFHERTVFTGEELLRLHAIADFKSTPDLYEKFVKSSDDGLLLEANDAESFSSAMWRLSDRNDKIAAELLALSWGLQTFKAFICSDVMDVRCVGAKLLSDRLVEMYQVSIRDVNRFDRPTVQYTTRYLRKTGMIAYIFGPESHAALIDQSKNMMAFLAATGSLTLAELDLIWRISTTSVEADFVLAAARALVFIAQWLTLDGIHHIIKKYIETPIDKISPHAVEALPGLYKHFEKKTIEQDSEDERLAIALTSIQLLQHAQSCASTPATRQLQDVALNQIVRALEPSAHLAEREAIYDYCTRNVINKTQHATAAFIIMQLILAAGISSEEAATILSLAPIASFVDELRAHMEIRHSRHGTHDVLTRMESILRLMSLTEDDSSSVTEEALFQTVYGNPAADENLRNELWNQLYNLAKVGHSVPAATKMWSHFMRDRVPILPAELATAQLVSFLGNALESQLGSVQTLHDFANFFQQPLWSTLVRFAISSPQMHVITAASAIVLDFLFVVPAALSESTHHVARSLCDFVKGHIDELDRLFQTTVDSTNTENARKFWHGVTLLKDILGRSKYYPGLARQSETIEIDNGPTTSDRISFQVQIRGPQPEAKTVSVTARPSTTVSELQASLRDVTGAHDNRVIAAGVEVTEASERTLDYLGIHQIGVLLISPRLVAGDDIDKAFPRAGPVEEEILHRYSTLEAFLDGPPQLAEKSFDFLRDVRLSHQTREKVVSAGVDANELFPPDRPSRAKFSLFVLRQHTMDLSRMASIDAQLSQRVIRLLAEFLTSKAQRDLQMILEALRVLEYTLDDCPVAKHLQPYFEDPGAFASRMFTLIAEAKRMQPHWLAPDGKTAFRTAFADVCYHVLFQAVVVDDALWKVVRERDPELIQLHKELLLDGTPTFSETVARQIRSACIDQKMHIPADSTRQDRSQESMKFYWRVLVSLLDYALSVNNLAGVYFETTGDIFSRMCNIGTMTEADIREFTSDLLTKLFDYRHKEMMSYINQDPAMVGLLRLLDRCAGLLGRTARGPDLGSVSVTLLQKLMFPPANASDYHPLVNEQTRSVAHNLIKQLYHREDLEDAIDVVINAAKVAPKQPGSRYPGLSNWLRPATGNTGLTNLGMTCYMNSLLQQLFANVQFRKFIIDEEIVDAQKQEVLAALQSLFARMQDSIDLHADTKALAATLSIQIGLQEDVHTFYTSLLSRLEECMLTQEKRQALAQFFTGKSVTQIRGDCGHVSARSEPFTELSITVRNKADLHESLDEFMQGEPLEGANRYKCMTCSDGGGGGKLVNAMRRTCLEELPDSLTLCLKRFAFDNYQAAENKVNDRFNFPGEIDMSRYKRDTLEDPASPHEADYFDLVGVIVHQGSLSYGHYWSYVRVPGQGPYGPPGWVHIEDETCTPCTDGLREVQNACSGGLSWTDGSERTDSGYVLFYQRRSYMIEAPKFSNGPLPSKVALPSALAAEVDNNNRWKLQIAAIFTDDFTRFVHWTMEKYPAALQNITTLISAAEPDDVVALETRVDDLETKMAELIAQYALRLLVADPDAPTRISKFASSVAAVLGPRKSTALPILRHFYEDRSAFETIIAGRDKTANAAVFDMVFKCLVIVREDMPQFYDEVIVKLIGAHESLLLEHNFIDNHPASWTNYLTFVARFANLGPNETGIVLSRGYLAWLFEILYIRYEMPSRKRHPFVWTQCKPRNLDMAPLFDFLYHLFGEHMDLSVSMEVIEEARKLGQQRLQTADGWCLTRQELGQLFCTTAPIPGEESRWMLLLATNDCRITNAMKWQDFPPGKLIGLLMSDRMNDDIRMNYEGQIITHIEHESDYLHPLFHVALNFCANRPDLECRAVMAVMGKNLPLWPSKNGVCLEFFRQTFKLSPVATLETVPLWATTKDPVFLLAKGNGTRRMTASWLREHLFTPEDFTDDVALDAARIRTTRALAKQCVPIVRYHYRQEEPKMRFEAMLIVIEDARDFLLGLQEAAKGAKLGVAVRAELDESRSTRTMLEDLLHEVDGWVGAATEGGEGASLPTRVKRTAGPAGVDLEPVDAEAEDAEGEEVLETSEDEDEGSEVFEDVGEGPSV